MYHFASEQTPELRLSGKVLVTSQTTQYLKSFQIEAVRFLYQQLSKQEFCILNDESGLGKSAAVVALLNALGASKKTLIVLQNDDQMLVGWQFHFGVLTDLPVCVIQNINDSTESAHSVYLAKWSVLRSIGDLSKLRFDFVIVDNRGYTLNNNFCTSMLLKQFERKVNIVISSVDITLLYNVLRMGGRLGYQFKSFRSFENKYSLPDAKEVFNKRLDLEEYYKQRGKLGDFVKEFRLRRYRHQFDQYLPLVTPEQYKTNLTLWLANNNSDSTLSGSTVASTIDARSTAGTEEIIECLMKIKREREMAQRDEPEKFSEHSDEVVAMSPLIFEMSDAEIEEDVEEQPLVVAIEPATTCADVVMISSDDCEIVTPPKTPSPVFTTDRAQKDKRKFTKLSQAVEQEHLTDSEVEIVTPERKKQGVKNTPKGGKNKKINGKQSSVALERTNVVQPQTGNGKIVRRTRSANSTPVNNSKTKKLENKHFELAKETPMRRTRSAGNTPSSSNRTKKVNVLLQRIELETTQKIQSTPSQKKAKGVISTPKSESTKPAKRLLREVNIAPKGVHNRETRGMQRLTRSADSRIRNKYMTITVALDIDKKPTPRKPKTVAGQTPKTSRNQTKNTPEKLENQTPKRSKRKSKTLQQDEKVTTTPKTKSNAKPRMQKQQKDTRSPLLGPKPKAKTTAPLPPAAPSIQPTPQLISSGSTNSNCSFTQCAQKLPDNLSQLDALEPPAFRMPFAPISTSLLLPYSLNLFSDSEVGIVPASNQQTDIVVISSSYDESSGQSSAQSRRTRALKRKRQQRTPVMSPHDLERPSTSSFGLMLAQQRTQNKSPDLFSNCSGVSQLPLTQPAPASTATGTATGAFEGFKIFGSEVKHLQQQHAKTQANNSTKKKRDRSCLDILEQMFEPRHKKDAASSNNVLPTYPPAMHAPPTAQRRRSVIEDDIFEITNNGEFGSRLRLNSTGDVSPVQQQQQHKELGPTQHKITNYLIGSSAGQEDEPQQQQQLGPNSRTSTQTLRKSPKGIKSTQSTKLTRWFGTASSAAASPTCSGESLSAPSTPVMSTTSAATQSARIVRRSGPTKRKRLDLFK
ncbi:protein suppressor of underreplication isoform X2 [Scaptodrosophila lebanonensis]|uniref:Protein suppressor of underreplication isoform X2 n=1 Tax=Drosophila lebanonensis TaxID=7225 RepID=A0A6J2T8M1_DROLE|nr:protein suppressor of underreplication isoform X2 [Scaptodrosophila lebanonensis]